MEDLTSFIEGLGTTALVGLGLLVLVQLTLMVTALVSLVRRPEAALRGPKWLWALIIIFGELIGPILYFALARVPEQVDIVIPGAALTTQRADSVADVLYGSDADTDAATNAAGQAPTGGAS